MIREALYLLEMADHLRSLELIDQSGVVNDLFPESRLQPRVLFPDDDYTTTEEVTDEEMEEDEEVDEYIGESSKSPLAPTEESCYSPDISLM